MQNRRFDWHERIKAIEGEFKAAKLAVLRLKHQLDEVPNILGSDVSRAHVNNATINIEGTYIVRLFAVFEATLKSYDRARHKDPTRKNDAAVLIDSTGGRRGQGISASIRKAAHLVRELRNDWAHENNRLPIELAMPLAEARAKLQNYLSWLPDEWDDLIVL